MYYDQRQVEAIHRDRIDQLRRMRNPRRRWTDGSERNPRRGPRPDREL